jgi:hypothetical protein
MGRREPVGWWAGARGCAGAWARARGCSRGGCGSGARRLAPLPRTIVPAVAACWGGRGGAEGPRREGVGAKQQAGPCRSGVASGSHRPWRRRRRSSGRAGGRQQRRPWAAARGLGARGAAAHRSSGQSPGGTGCRAARPWRELGGRGGGRRAKRPPRLASTPCRRRANGAGGVTRRAGRAAAPSFPRSLIALVLVRDGAGRLTPRPGLGP